MLLLLNGYIFQQLDIEQQLIECDSFYGIWLSAFNHNHLDYLLNVYVLFLPYQLNILHILHHLLNDSPEAVDVKQNVLLVLFFGVFVADYLRTLFIRELIGWCCQH